MDQRVSSCQKTLVTSFQLRDANPEDAPHILRFIKELADYEREPDAVEATVESLTAQMESTRPPFECIIAEVAGASAPEPVGFALYFQTYSTWKGRPGIWLEDLYVTPSARRLGIGQALLKELAKRTVERGFGRLEWTVLDWNQPAIDFYLKLGSAPLDEWTTHRVSGDALTHLAK